MKGFWMGSTPENADPGSVMLKRPDPAEGTPSADFAENPFMDLFARTDPSEIWGGNGPDRGDVRPYVDVRNLNAQGEDPVRVEDIPPKPAVEIGLTFGF